MVRSATGRPRRWSWRYLLVGLAFLPVLFSSGGCPNLANAADDASASAAWFCPLFR